MTAPAAPIIVAHSDGLKVYVRFANVSGAATYNLYSGGATAPTTLDKSLTPDAASSWQQIASMGDGSHPVFVRATAVNAGAEESAYSNEVVVWLNGPGRQIVSTSRTPFGN